jgi:hypothetical protein
VGVRRELGPAQLQADGVDEGLDGRSPVTGLLADPRVGEQPGQVAVALSVLPAQRAHQRFHLHRHERVGTLACSSRTPLAFTHIAPPSILLEVLPSARIT